MIISSGIFDDYLKNHNIDKHKDNWLFKHLKNLSGGMEVFLAPSYSPHDIKSMEKIAFEIRKEIKDFIPNNLDLWNLLFPDWENTISHVTVHLLVGLPKGFDSLALQDLNGRPIVVYDIGNWLAYKNLSIANVANNLLTHELAHVCIDKASPAIMAAYETGEYHEALDAIVFNEGFAHLLAFEGKNIALVDWRSEKFRRIYEGARQKLKAALPEKDADKQRQNLKDAAIGNYHGKFGAMAGMLFMAEAWLEKGNLGLKEIFGQGYLGLSKKIIADAD